MNKKDMILVGTAYEYYTKLNLVWNLQSLFYINENEVSIYDLITDFKKEKALLIIIASGCGEDTTKAELIIRKFIQNFKDISLLVNFVVSDLKNKHHFFEYCEDDDKKSNQSQTHDKLLKNEKKLLVEMLSTLVNIGYKLDEALAMDYKYIKYINYIISKRQQDEINFTNILVYKNGIMNALAILNNEKYPSEPEIVDLTSDGGIVTREQLVENIITAQLQTAKDEKEQKEMKEKLIALLNYLGDEQKFIDVINSDDSTVINEFLEQYNRR
jgi:hypothetical protein